MSKVCHCLLESPMSAQNPSSPLAGGAWEGLTLCLCAHAGASQATNRESIQKSISRLDEDLNTLGQVSKLSETLSFPHQVWKWGPGAVPWLDTFPVGPHRMTSVRGENLWNGWWPKVPSPKATEEVWAASGGCQGMDRGLSSMWLVVACP